jgi:hypothetical protein
MLNTRRVRWVDFVLHAKLHFCKELQGPQHCHQWYWQFHTNQYCKKATHITSANFQSRCGHVGEKIWHNHAYVNPLLILEVSRASICKSQKSHPFPYGWLLLWKKSLVHISKLHLQVASSHQIGLFYQGKVHSYHAHDLMDHPSWNGITMLFAWKFKHNHLKL